MPRKTTKQKALEHYDRMIAWAEKQPENSSVLTNNMFEAIGESDDASACLYCQKYKKKYSACSNCELYENMECCNHLWQKMYFKNTWGAWVKAAKKVREYIEAHG